MRILGLSILGLIVFLAIAAGGALAQERPATLTLDGVTASRIPDAYDAVMMAAADAESLQASGQGVFYIFLPRPSREAIAAHVYALNCSVSHAETGLAPDVLFGGHLLRVDLKRWCPDPVDFATVVAALTGYEDQYFYVREQGLVPSAPYKASDGKTYTQRLEKLNVFPAHIAPSAAKSLKETTLLTTPIVYGPRWLGQSLRTLEGGIYYKLRGYDKINQKEWLAKLGADEAVSEALGGNSFVGRFRSKVTNKPRRGVAVFGVAARPAESYPLVVLTQDVADGVSAPDKHPVYSLLEFEYAATELIGVLPNGFPTAFLANAKGERQDVVPPNIAADHTIPAPHTRNLEPIISCGRCHGPDDFYKPFANDIARLDGLERAKGFRAGVFGDLSAANQAVAYDDLRAKYGGDMEGAFMLARNAQERSCFRVTGMGVSECWAAIASEWEAHYYEPVQAYSASLDLGWALPVDCTEEQAARFFRELVPPLPVNSVGISPEDPVIAGLCDWIKGGDAPESRLEPIRLDWERVYRDAALRARDSVLARAATAAKGEQP